MAGLRRQAQFGPLHGLVDVGSAVRSHVLVAGEWQQAAAVAVVDADPRQQQADATVVQAPAQLRPQHRARGIDQAHATEVQHQCVAAGVQRVGQRRDAVGAAEEECPLEFQHRDARAQCAQALLIRCGIDAP
jgi:hypothetical protein